MIVLDGFPYIVEKAEYADRSTALANYGRGLTGAVLVVESGILTQEYIFKLNVSQKEAEQLTASFSSCHTTPKYLTFVDERDVFFDTAAGTDSANHKFSTGVWFASVSEPKPTEALFDPLVSTWFTPHKRFIVEVRLVVNAKVIT